MSHFSTNPKLTIVCSVGKVVAFYTRGPRFESSRWHFFIKNTCLLSTVLKRQNNEKEAAICLIFWGKKVYHHWDSNPGQSICKLPMSKPHRSHISSPIYVYFQCYSYAIRCNLLIKRHRSHNCKVSVCISSVVRMDNVFVSTWPDYIHRRLGKVLVALAAVK